MLKSREVLLGFVVVLFVFLGSFWFMNHAFSSSDGKLLISSKSWSDFSSTIPLIRSFSLGKNMPPEFPLFSGYPIKYHFMFYLAVGLLERIGFSISFALNLLSSIAITSLIITTYLVGSRVFRSKLTGFISVILLLFNGSLAFFEFFKIHPLSFGIFTDIINNNAFSSFGPYDGKIVSAFWNLNIYTNQRHLAMAYFLFLVFVFYLWKNYRNPDKLTIRSSILIGIFIGVMPFVHMAVFSMTGLALIIYLLFYPAGRRYLLLGGIIALLIAIPQVLYMGTTADTNNLIKLGYLIEDLTAFNFASYWLFNLGLTVVLFPLGFYLSNRHQKLFLLPFIALFIIGNLFQLSPEIAANHKFFNLFLIGINFYTAFLLTFFFHQKNIAYKILSVCLIFTMTLSGFIDLFPVLNDSKIEIDDYKTNPTTNYIYRNTPRDSTFLNSTFLYSPASMAGRKIFVGWPYFAWSAGYDTYARGELFDKLYTTRDREEFCLLLEDNNLDYFTVEDTHGDVNLPEINVQYFLDNYSYLFEHNGVYIFSVENNCS